MEYSADVVNLGVQGFDLGHFPMDNGLAITDSDEPVKVVASGVVKIPAGEWTFALTASNSAPIFDIGGGEVVRSLRFVGGNDRLMVVRFESDGLVPVDLEWRTPKPISGFLELSAAPGDHRFFDEDIFALVGGPDGLPVVPEPSSLVLLALGGLAALSRRRHR